MTTAQPEISKGRAFNPIWIIPAVALLLGVYMVIHAWMTEGPEITIAFNTAEGLVAGKTKIKYRDVEMGLIEEVLLTDDFKGVVAKAKLDRQALPLLREDTRFWVVTARVSLGNVSGLGTLLSGAYIQLSPGTEGKPGKREFEALEKPPLTPADAPGLRLHLLSDRAGSVSAGDAVLYKGYRVGRVESMEFDAEVRKVRYVLFIDAPFHELVDSSVRFWNTSGISLSAGADGFTVSTGSMDTVLLGGVAFDRPPDIPPGESVAANAEFELYKDYQAILENPFVYGTYFVTFFTESIKGLRPGAPVEYRGIPVGRVEKILLNEMIQANMVQLALDPDREATGVSIPVLLYMEPGRLTLPDQPASLEILVKSITTGVPNGMRASLETGNLITGAKYVGIDFYPGVDDDAVVGEWGGHVTIPSIGGGVDQILVKVNSILDKIDDAPLKETISNANAALDELKKTLASLDAIVGDKSTQELPANLDATLQELRQTLDGLSPDGDLYQNVNSSLRRLERTLGNLETMTRTLSGQPNAAVMPSQLPSDPQPEAR